MIDAPQANMGGEIPPELAQLLMGGAGAGEVQAPAAPPPSETPAAEDGVDPLEHLRAAIEHAQAALVAEPDDADSEALSKLVSGLYRILANRQKDQDQALGNPTIARTLRRSG